jgi:hypothetical protein
MFQNYSNISLLSKFADKFLLLSKFYWSFEQDFHFGEIRFPLKCCPSSAGSTWPLRPVIPAKAGIQASLKAFVDSRMRGNDAATKFQKFNLDRTGPEY